MPKKKLRRLKTKDEKQQLFCKDCERPINKNNAQSVKLNGVCNKCFNINNTEKDKRKILKKITKIRKNERLTKFL